MKSTLEMAREAGGYDSPEYPNNLVMDSYDLERLVELIRAEEREACAKECKFGRSSADIEQAIRAKGSNT